MENFRDVFDEIEKSNAVSYKERIRRLEINFSFLAGNYLDLCEILNKVDVQDGSSLYFNLSSVEIDDLIQEVSRKMINFISMAKSLVDCNRNLIEKWYEYTDFYSRYKKEVEKNFTGNQLIEFVEGLRNYIMHYELPIVNARLHVDHQNGSSITGISFPLKKSRLLKWENWADKGLPYLLEQKEEINLKLIIDEYYNLVFDFNSWLLTELNSLHQDDFIWLESKINEFKKFRDAQNDPG